MAMTQRARNLFRMPEVHLCDERDGYRIQGARELLLDIQRYIAVHDFKNALNCIIEARYRLRLVSGYLAIRDQLEDAFRIASTGLGKDQ